MWCDVNILPSKIKDFGALIPQWDKRKTLSIHGRMVIEKINHL